MKLIFQLCGSSWNLSFEHKFYNDYTIHIRVEITDYCKIDTDEDETFLSLNLIL